jgi:hypothetical protein
MTEAMAHCPFDPNRFFYGTGATLYGSTDATLWDDNNINSKFHISVKAQGISVLLSPPCLARG